jgi:hypothetical protein
MEGAVTRDDYLLALQRLVATEKGYEYLQVFQPERGLCGVLHADEGPTLVPRWPWEWCEAGKLLEEMARAEYFDGYKLEHRGPGSARPHESRVTFHLYGTDGVSHAGGGSLATDAIARCWLAWKGVDLSDLPAVSQ